MHRARVEDTIDLVPRQRMTLVRSAKYDVYQARFSPNGRWIVFAAGSAAQSRLFIAAIRDGKAVSETEWIAIGDRGGWSNKPRWSPDGRLIYFVSRRDGYYCLWAQRVALGKEQPAEGPFNVAHFHKTHLSMMQDQWTSPVRRHGPAHLAQDDLRSQAAGLKPGD